jgi:hypothetical protein
MSELALTDLGKPGFHLRVQINAPLLCSALYQRQQTTLLVQK